MHHKNNEFVKFKSRRTRKYDQQRGRRRPGRCHGTGGSSLQAQERVSGSGALTCVGVCPACDFTCDGKTAGRSGRKSGPILKTGPLKNASVTRQKSSFRVTSHEFGPPARKPDFVWNEPQRDHTQHGVRTVARARSVQALCDPHEGMRIHVSMRFALAHLLISYHPDALYYPHSHFRYHYARRALRIAGLPGRRGARPPAAACRITTTAAATR